MMKKKKNFFFVICSYTLTIVWQIVAFSFHFHMSICFWFITFLTIVTLLKMFLRAHNCSKQFFLILRYRSRDFVQRTVLRTVLVLFERQTKKKFLKNVFSAVTFNVRVLENGLSHTNFFGTQLCSLYFVVFGQVV